MRRTRYATAAVLLAAATVLAACGGDEEDTGSDDGDTGSSEDGGDSGDSGSEAGSEGGGGAEGGAEGTLTVGIKFDQPGIGLQEGSEYTGLDVDVAHYVAEALGYSEDQVEFVQSVSAQREDMIENGQVDMIVASYSITEERMERVAFAGPYFVAGQDLLVRSGESDIGGPEDLDGSVLCSVEGSTSAQRIQDEYSEGVELFPAQTYSECVEFLSAGTVDAVTTDDVILAGFANQEQYQGQFEVVGAPFSEENYGIGVAQGSEMCEEINAAIETMLEDGSWETFLSDNAGEFTYNEELNPPTPGGSCV
ncbi:glutamate ABC transporter substrate-binding protein [Georgenia sp. Z1344]|uniref:glutamate ABC transporter substrate-binding protein n=1 Tax=Georgenia sp. Z1344 TaxID=3416706 RepID=UPI003CF5B10A